MAEHDGYSTLRVAVDAGVAWVTIDHPPVNLFDLGLFVDLTRVFPALLRDDDVRVIVLGSADPEFFVAHADVAWILTLPDVAPPPLVEPGPFVAFLESVRRSPKPTIGMLAGIARGGGSELLLSLDMRFAARSRSRLAQPEVALGIIPGAGGTQRLARYVGRARALEVILGCGDVDADEAAAMGWVNRALPDDELEPFVRELAERIARMPVGAVQRAKAAVDAAWPPVESGLLVEGDRFNECAADPRARELMRGFLEIGGQTREVELELGRLLRAGFERRG